MSGPGAEGGIFHRHLLEKLRSERDRLDASLAAHIPELANSAGESDAAELAQALPPRSALVHFVHYRKISMPHVASTRSDGSDDELVRYAAFIVRADDTNPKLVDIGGAESINLLLAEFRAKIGAEGASGYGLINQTRFEPEEIKSWLAPGIALRETLFDPLLCNLDGCDRLFIVPDGDLCHLPIGTLPLGESQFVLDRFKVNYLSFGRDLVKFGDSQQRSRNPPMVVADPDYDLAEVFRGQDTVGSVLTPARNKEESNVDDLPEPRQSRAIKSHSLYFQRLPGTEVEGHAVAHTLGVTPLTSGMALETTLRNCVSPAILHIATHGFFLSNQDEAQAESANIASFLDSQLSLHYAESPLLRSGLALAGANTWLAGSSLSGNAGDGLLTAKDVSTMNLSDTRLVVLSACDTGIGEVEAGEGVLGLRRSFRLAGAATVVMSLWKVPDGETTQLMIEFYRRLS